MAHDEYASFVGIYDPLTAPFLAGARRMVRRALDRLVPSGSRVLDLGCGTGVLARGLAGHGWRVTCLDASASMLGRSASAAGSCPTAKGPGAPALVRADATAMPLAGGVFQACVTVFVLHEMEPKVRRAALAEARRVLAPGGRLLAVDYMLPGRRALTRPWRAASLLAARLPEKGAGERHYRMFREYLAAGALEGLLRRAGLEPEPLGRCLLGAAGLMAARV